MELDRRTVLQASGVIAAGGLVAACSSGGSESAATSAGPESSAAEASSAPAPASSAAPEGSAPAAPADAVAAASDIPVGGGLILDEPAVVVTQPTEGDIKAFTAICPHQGCLVSEVVDNEIICPCHGSKFSASDGAVISGPAQSPLQPAGVAVEGGSVVLT